MGVNSTQTTHLADSLCARLCHEMSGPLGTISGALDLAGEDPDGAAESVQLAQEAAGEMVRRLRLLRAAWAGDCGALDAASLGELASGLPPRVHVVLDGLLGKFAARTARILVNMLLLGMEALPRGGTVRLIGTPEDEIVLMVAGTHAAWPAGLAGALADPMAAALDEPRAMQAPLVALLAAEAGLRLSLMLPTAGQHSSVPPLVLTSP